MVPTLRSTAAARMLRGSRCGSSASLTVGVLGCAELESSAGGRDRVLRLMSILVKTDTAKRRFKNASEPLQDASTAGRGVRCAECMYMCMHMPNYDHVCMCARTHTHTCILYIYTCINIYTYTYTYVQSYTHLWRARMLFVHTYIYIYTRMYIHLLLLLLLLFLHLEAAA